MQRIHLLINKCEITCLQHFNDSEAFPEYSNYMDDSSEIIQEYNPNKERKIVIVFCNRIVDMLRIKNLTQ